VFHTATFEYDGEGERFGNRAAGLGERPCFDPKSVSRRDALSERTNLVQPTILLTSDTMFRM